MTSEANFDSQSATSTAVANSPEPERYESSKKSMQFWLIFLGTSVSVFLSALELTSVGTALPTIVKDLGGDDFIWVGSAYALASAAFMPMFGGLSNIFGRRAVMLTCIAIFSVGSVIAGASHSMNMLIIARTIQGSGGGGIIALSEIIVADLVPLRERGKFGGIIGAVWALASVLGPPIGGALATGGQWRWLFYLNLPLSAIAAALVFMFLSLRTPAGSMTEKLRRVDWIGNLIIIASTASLILALTWGGVAYSWISSHVLAPLVVGAAGVAAFMIYEIFFAKYPVVPKHLLWNRTSFSGYASTLVHGIALTLVVYYLPTYFQGAKGVSAIRSGILLFTTAFLVAPFSIATGQTVERTGHYVIQNYIGWVLVAIGYGTMSLLKYDSSIAMAEGLQVVGAAGLGMLYVGPQFAVLAPLSVEDNAHALALMSYFRTFGQAFGITIGTTILQNGLKSRLPSEFLLQFPNGAEISYSVIPLVKTLSQPLQNEVKAAFSNSIAIIWYWVVGLAALGLLVTLPMQQLTLHTVTDEKWGLQNSKVESEETRAEKGESRSHSPEKMESTPTV